MTSPHSPYRPDPEPPQPQRPTFAWGAFGSCAWVSVCTMAMIAICATPELQNRKTIFFLVAGLMMLGVFASIGVIIVTRKLDEYGYERPIGSWFAGLSVVMGLGLSWFAALITYGLFLPAPLAHGRRHRKHLRALRPTLDAGDDWCIDLPSASIPNARRDAIAAEWRETGCKEHASVAAFAQLTVSLMAVGAPPKLIRDAQQDSIDEIEHTQICFAVARAIDGQAIAPAAFPEARAQKRLFTGSRRLALAQIALDALADGVLNEGVAARLLAELAQRCELEEVKPWLTKMAADESRHAAHSWEIVEFCLEQGGLTVAAALRSACTRLPERLPSTLPADAHDGAWSTWGVHSLAMEEAAFAKTRRNVERKLNALLARHAAAQRERGIAA